jgi:hypothetical protein
MARKSQRNNRKMEPAVTRLWFHIDPNSSRNFVDLSFACSAANRRFYRQGMKWAVAGMSLHTGSNTTGTFDVSKVPDSWIAQNAHKKSKQLWMKSQDQVIDEQPSIKARYRDFKVYLDAEMASATKQPVSNSPAASDTIMLPVDRNNQIAKYSEWIYSSIQFPVDGGAAAPAARELHFVGGDNGGVSKGMIHGYGLSRSRPQSVDPNTPGEGGWMNDVFDVADNLDEIREDVEDENNVPPYRVGTPGETEEYYPGGENNQPDAALHSTGFVSGTTVGGKTHIEGGLFNCGLIRFDWDLTQGTGDPDLSMYLAIDLVPGTHKGYLAEAY